MKKVYNTISTDIWLDSKRIELFSTLVGCKSGIATNFGVNQVIIGVFGLFRLIRFQNMPILRFWAWNGHIAPLSEGSGMPQIVTLQHQKGAFPMTEDIITPEAFSKKFPDMPGPLQSIIIETASRMEDKFCGEALYWVY